MPTPPTDFMPEMVGFSRQVSREMIDSALIQQSGNFEVRASLRESPLFRYKLNLVFAHGYAPAYTIGHEVSNLTRFWLSKSGRVNTFLFVDPVSGTMRKEYIDTGDGNKKVFTLTDLDGLTAKHIQSISVFGEVVRHVQPTTMPWELGPNAQWLYDSDEDGTPPVVIEVTPGETVKISAVGGVDGGPGVPEYGPDGGAYDTSGLTLPSDVAGVPSSQHFAGLMGAFCNASGHVIQPMFVGAGGVWNVPENATRLQLGVNEYHFSDCTGPGFTATILRSSRATIIPSEYSVYSHSCHLTFDDAPQLGERLSWSGVCAKVVRFDSGMDINRIMSQIYEGGSEIVLFTPPGAQ